MNLLSSLNWSEVFFVSVAPLEIVIRGTIMYWFILILLRVAGRRDIGSLGVADMLVLVLIADAAQNGMAGQASSVGDSMILIATIVAWTVIVDRLIYFVPPIAHVLSTDRVCLVHDGVICRRNLRRESITEQELMAELRLKGVDELDQVRRAYIEANGNISVLPTSDHQRAAAGGR